MGKKQGNFVRNTVLRYWLELMCYSWTVLGEMHKKIVLFEHQFFNATGEDHFLESKKPMCLQPRKWDCCSDLFCQNWRSFNKQQCFCKSNGTAGSRGTRLLIEGLQPRLEPKSMLPTFAKAPCCLELFRCCCLGLSQHGMGEVLIPLRHCWRDAFFCVCLGSWSFCHEWASHCSVLF